MKNDADQAPLIDIKDLKYSYTGEKNALNGVNLKIWPGERVAILGSNGAGKSTFFLNLNGVLKRQAGEIRLKGRTMGTDKKDLNKLREHIGIVFQDADNQIIASTVRAEVSFGPMNLGLTKDQVQVRVDEALEEMNITSYADRAPHYLSGGEKKRVAIADIIAMHPEIFVFDEPTAALDPVGAQMLEDTLKLLSKAGKTVLISTHMVDFAWRWAERIIVFSNGRVLAEGAPEEIFTNEAVLAQADLKPPMLLSITREMIDAGYLPENTVYPHDLDAFNALLKQDKA